jgi:hypothetical protein
MREHVLLFCLLGLVLTATIILVTAPEAVTWALALIEWAEARSFNLDKTQSFRRSGNFGG